MLLKLEFIIVALKNTTDSETNVPNANDLGNSDGMTARNS